MFVRRYLQRLQDALAESRGQPLAETRAPVWGVFSLTLAWLLAWGSLGSESQPHLFFREGGMLDWLSGVYLMTAALLAWSAWLVGRTGPARVSPFWLVAGGGLAFLAIDERFQFHEKLFSHLLQRKFGDVPFGLRSWNDLIVVGYGVAGLLLVAWSLPAILRCRGLRTFLAAGIVFYVLHTGTDMLFPRSMIKSFYEEPFKLLSGASILLGFLQGFVYSAKVAGRSAGDRRLRLSWQITGIAVLAIGVTVLAYAGGPDWVKGLARKWGPPSSWLMSVLLGAAALMLWFAGSVSAGPRRAGAWAWRLVAAILSATAVAESTRACTHVFKRARDLVPELAALGGQGSVLHLPLGLRTLAVVGLIAIAAFLGRRAIRPDGWAAGFFAAGVAVWMALAVWLRLVPAATGQASLMALLIAVCACFALSAQTLLIDRASS